MRVDDRTPDEQRLEAKRADERAMIVAGMLAYHEAMARWADVATVLAVVAFGLFLWWLL